jgi:hypothetical protein
MATPADLTGEQATEQAVKTIAVSATAPEVTTPATSAQPSPTPRHQPIPPASEPMQYRAIGLVRGKYTPSIEQFTRGFILTDDGVLIDAVLLGRVMSLVKKHIELEESHLWVVYPRTREKDLELHMQIVGIWEPEKLNRPAHLTMNDANDEAEVDETETDEIEDSAEPEDSVELVDPAESEDELEAATEEVSLEAESESQASEEAEPDIQEFAQSSETLTTPDDLDDCYFSVRGEVVYQSEEEKRLLVKIRRAPKPGTTQAKTFKVALAGTLEGKAVGYFWDFHIQRENNDLVIREAKQIGMVPPQKRTGGSSGSRPPRRGGSGRPQRGGQASGPPRKRWQNRDSGGSREVSRPQRAERQERPSTPSAPRQPISKPVKRRPNSEQG